MKDAAARLNQGVHSRERETGIVEFEMSTFDSLAYKGPLGGSTENRHGSHHIKSRRGRRRKKKEKHQ